MRHRLKNRPQHDKKNLKLSESRVEGVISINEKGIGYVRTEKGENDIEIETRFLNTALHGDRVEVLIHPRKKGCEKITGEITKILVRARSGFAGTLEFDKGVYFLIPQDPRMYTNIIIPERNLGGGKQGDKVFGVITLWRNPHKNPEGKIIEILGKPGENNTEMLAIALERGFGFSFPTKAKKEAVTIRERGIRPEDFKNRRDFRGTLTFTIDPEDAKDFDDALSIKKVGQDRYEIGIHIADVSHYVKPASELDKEAEKRGTSVYLVDRTIPMLPEELSNDLCSLNPNTDRLTMSAVFISDKNGRIYNEWFGKSIIHSSKRFTYEEAQKSLDNNKAIYHEELTLLNTIAKKLLKNRHEEGALSLEQEEIKFELDPQGKPVRIYKKIRGDSHKLIEEWMLLANRKVAEFVKKYEKKTARDHVFIYRVHDVPSYEKAADLAFFLNSVGYPIKLQKGKLDSKELRRVLLELEGKTEKDMIQTVIVRSMAKAVYATQNIGHYGLAFDHYTHFTSPIRRYPDILVHRLLYDYLEGRERSAKDWHIFDTLANYSSQREREAADAERASIRYKQVEYMSSRIGQIFDGIISGVSEWGIFIEEKETKCEGMVRLRDLKNDFYVFDEKHYRVIGERTKKTYRIGDRVRFKVVKADMDRKTLDYALV